MTFWNWRRQHGSRANQAFRRRARRAHRALDLEPLEDRLVPSGPGTLDPTFGSGGTVSVSLSASLPADFLNAVALQPDGKIVAAGGVNSGGQAGEFAVARFDPDGGLDPTFGTGGATFTSLATLPPGFANGTVARGVALQPDGKIVLAGYYSAPGGLNHFGLARYNPDGSLDTSFGTGGVVTDPVDSDDFATAVALQPDGKIVVVGAAGPNFSAVNFAVVRYNADGSRDTTFGSGGVVETPPPFATDAAANAVVIQPDGKIVVGGHTSTSGGDFHYAVLRYQADGSLDPTFGSGGEVFDNFGPGFGGEDVRALALQPDGKVLAAGVVVDSNRGVGDFALARYNPDGSLDTSFAGTGRTTLNVNGSNDASDAVAVQANGKIVVAGDDGAPGGSGFLTARFDADGTLDPTFGSGGSVAQKFSQDGNDNAHAVAIQPDGKVVVAGTAAEGNTDSNFALARYFGDPSDFPLTAGGVAVTATAGAPFSGAVATFTDADPAGTAGQFTATITWGDGATSAGVVTADVKGGFDVTGTHTYAAAGGYAVGVQVVDVGGSTAAATSTATVTDLGQRVRPGQAAGVGFWHGKGGQALVEGFNGGSASTDLSAWLAATFPNLYGAGAGANDLGGDTNAQVAAFYQTLFARGGPKADAEVLAAALNVYATTSSLGGSAGEAYGFTVSPTGLGARSFEVGQDGAAFGVPNNSTLNVYELLAAVNQRAVNGVLYGGDPTLQREAADLFDALNEAGRI